MELAPCPDSPNCVSTKAHPSDRQHHIAPLTYEGDTGEARARLKRIVLAMPRVHLEAEDEDGLHFVFTTRLLRFRDDVHFVFEDGTVHFRSASRVGHSDLGVNRKRMEAIRAAWVSG